MEPKFSIIVPIYKVEKFLHQCIDSVLYQTYHNFELILVDDGSPDNCPAICDEYAAKDNRIRVLHKENGGLVSARIAGAKEAKGDYVCCLDGDDWLHPQHLAHLANVVGEKEPDVICFGCYWAYEDKNVEYRLSYQPRYYTKQDIEKNFYNLLIQNEYAGYFSISIWNKAYKREMYQTEQFLVDPKIKIGEDGACTLPIIYRANSMYVLEDCLYYYRQNAASMTKEKKAFNWSGPKMVAEHLQKRINLDEYDFKQQWYRKTLHELFLVTVSQFYRKESYFDIVRDIKQNLREPIYAEAIRNARFKGFSGKMAHFALKYRVMPLIKLWSMVKNV